MRTRRLGRTGLEVSEIGFGGAPAGLANYLDSWDPASDAAAQQIAATVQRAADLGVTYFDSAPGYGAGRSEEMLALGLRGRRDGVIVATKVTGDDAEAHDVLQEALVRTFSKRRTFTHVNAAEAYVRRAIPTVYLDGLRKRKSQDRNHGRAYEREDAAAPLTILTNWR